MPITFYSFKLGREIPLLSDSEYLPIEKALGRRLHGIKEYKQKHNCSLEDAKRYSLEETMEYYASLTNRRLFHPDELYWVRLSDYGRTCPQCGKLFRTPKAKLCAECGFELPKGELAGRATFPDL